MYIFGFDSFCVDIIDWEMDYRVRRILCGLQRMGMRRSEMGWFYFGSSLESANWRFLVGFGQFV